MGPNPNKDKLSNNQHIFVAVRCRPMNASESADKCWSAVENDADKKTVSVKERPLLGAPTKTFTFDKVFGTRSKQVDVYKSVVEPAIEEVIMGYNCTIFAYGQTGTGKTYTMEGERSAEHLRWEDDPSAGIIPRSLAHLFERLEAMAECEFSMRVSYLELYNEELFDLLGAAECESKMRIYDDAAKKGSVVIQGLEEVVVTNKHEVYSILKKGSLRRQTASTVMNATSSRSHTVFTVTIHTRENSVDGEELVKTGKLNLVDLAGSENIGRSGAVDKRAREAGSINQSLLTLGRVITALVDRTPHVPYRESKLTRILQDSLGGRTKTSIIATISPASSNLEETLSTLDYAHRAKNIQNKPEINQRLTKKNLIKDYTEEIERLRRDLQANKDKNGIYINEENYKGMQTRLAALDVKVKEQDEEMKELNEEIKELNEEIKDRDDELIATKQQLADTATRLDETEKTLVQTKSTLEQTTHQRDEQIHLVANHVTAERKLQSQAKRLINTVDQTTDHIGKLQTSRERKSATETDNFNTLDQFQSLYSKSLSGIREQTIQYQSQQQDHFTAVSNIVKSVEETEKAKLAFHNDLADTLMSETETRISSLLDATRDLVKKSDTCGQQVKELLHTYKGKLEGHVKELSHSVISYRDQLLQQVMSSASEQVDSQLSYTKTLMESVEKEKLQFSSRLMDFVNENHEKMSSLLLQVKTCLSSSAQLERDRYSQYRSLMQENRLDLDELEDLLTQKLTKIKTRLELQNQQEEAMTQEATRSNTAANELIEDCQHSCNRYPSSITAADKDFTQKLEEISANSVQSVDKYRQEYDVIKQRSAELTQRLVDSNDQLTSNITSSLDVFGKSVQQQVQRSQEELVVVQRQAKSSSQVFVERVTEKVVSLKTSLAEQNDLVMGNLSFMNTTSKDNVAASNRYTEQTDSSLAAREAELDDLIANQLNKDAPSGETPSRLEYSYPREIGKPLDHKKLISELKHGGPFVKEQLAQQLPLPESDSEDDKPENTESAKLDSVSERSDGYGEDNPTDDNEVQPMDENDSLISQTSKSNSESKENIPNECFVNKRRPNRTNSTTEPVSKIRQPAAAATNKDLRKLPTSVGKVKPASTSRLPSKPAANGSKLAKRKLLEPPPPAGRKQFRANN